MITMFQSSKKPVAKAVHVFDETSDAKWVPLNKSFITLAKIVLRAAAERLSVANITITLRCITHQGYRHLLLAGEEQDDTISALGATEEFIISNDMTLNSDYELLTTSKSVSVPIDYQGKRLGYLIARLFDDVETSTVHNYAVEFTKLDPAKLEYSLADVAKDIVSIIKRYQTRYRAIFIYGDQYYWIGNSLALRQLDQKIEQLERVIKPVFIRGDKGTGKNIAARTLHSLRHKSILPFIESSCHEWQESAATTILHALYAYAKGGTLYLRNIDHLSESNFNALQQFWAEKYMDVEPLGGVDGVGIMLSASRYDYVAPPQLVEWLSQNTHELILPDLTERQDDIKDLVRFYIREYSRDAAFDFTDEAWKILEAFSWQENVEQLKNVIKKIALVNEEPLVQVSLLESMLKD